MRIKIEIGKIFFYIAPNKEELFDMIILRQFTLCKGKNLDTQEFNDFFYCRLLKVHQQSIMEGQLYIKFKTKN